MARKQGVSIRTTSYQKFRGADFSTDPALVDDSRSPLCTNMISDGGGMPEKRPGWRTLHQLSGQVNGLFSSVYEGETFFYAHVGSKLYRWDETGTEPAELLSGLNDAKSRGVSLGGKLWIVTGGELVVCAGASAARAGGADAYIPTTIITRTPSGGGVTYEAVNLLTPYRKNGFQTDGTSKTFLLDSAPIDAEGEVKAWVWGTEVRDFTVDRTAGTVTFAAAPAAPSAGSADGLLIQFPKTVEGYAERVGHCSIVTAYGAGGSDRLVISGNPDYPNRDWISGLNDPSYFPDLGYATVGTEGVAILGYCRLGSTLAIVKEDNGQDSTVYFRTASVADDGAVTFPITQALSGVGAASAGSFANLLDEPLLLSGTGIYAITANYLTGDRVGQNRSFFINARLLEEDLRSAEAVSRRGMYLLSFPNGHVYVLDGRQNKTYRSESLGDFIYEGYYWEHVPARCWLNWHRPAAQAGEREALFFGTADGRICRFSTDLEDLSRFSDDGEPIDAVWATKMDDDGDATILKTMLKRGGAVTLKPYSRSSAEVCLRTDRDAADVPIRTGAVDIFSWEDIDFSRFTFDSNDGAREIFFQTKVKKYKRLQILIRNRKVNEGFGVYGITKHFVNGNFAKR